MTDIKKASIQLAHRIDRRQFLRRAASKSFLVAAGVSVGSLSGLKAWAAPIASCGQPTGLGCPQFCGPSECCDKGSRSSACNCAVAGTTQCKDNGNHCHGRDTTWPGSSPAGCWSCTRDFDCGNPGCICIKVTTCCDCQTTGCGDLLDRCIAHTVTQTGPFC